MFLVIQIHLCCHRVPHRPIERDLSIPIVTVAWKYSHGEQSYSQISIVQWLARKWNWEPRNHGDVNHSTSQSLKHESKITRFLPFPLADFHDIGFYQHRLFTLFALVLLSSVSKAGVTRCFENRGNNCKKYYMNYGYTKYGYMKNLNLKIRGIIRNQYWFNGKSKSIGIP